MGAFGVALLVVIGAVVWFFVGADVSAEEQQAIQVCEELALEEGLPPIVRGDVAPADEDGVISVAWEFEDGTLGGCDAVQDDEGRWEATIVGDIADTL